MNYLKKIILTVAIISMVITTSVLSTASDDLYIKLKVGDTNAYINDTVTKLEAAPFIDPGSNRTLVPLRFISEAFGAIVEWEEGEVTKEWLDANADKKSQVEKVKNINITVKGGNSTDLEYPVTWYLRLGRSDAWSSNDVKKEDAFFDSAPLGNLSSMMYTNELKSFSKDMEQAPVIVNGRTMVPLRFIAEKIMNLEVEWDNNTKSIILKKNTNVSHLKTPINTNSEENIQNNSKVQKLDLVSLSSYADIEGDNCFYVPVSNQIKKGVENGTITWNINFENKFPGFFTLEKSKDNKLFISRPEKSLYENPDRIDITDRIKTMGIDINKLDLEIVDIHDYDDSYVVLKLSDGKISVLLFSKWASEKNLSNEVYNQQDVFSINVISDEGVGTKTFVEYLTVKRNGKFYISEYNRETNETKEFEVPEEITDITRMRSSVHPTSNLNLSYIKGSDKTGKQSFYKIDYAGRTITKYPLVEDLNDRYGLKWSFTGDLNFYSVLDENDDILMLYGHDGQISGFHEYDEVVAVKKSTGESVWKVSDHGFGKSCSISKDKKRIYIVMNTWLSDKHNKLVCLDVETGKIQWEKEFPEYFSIIESYKGDGKLGVVNDNIILHLYSDEGDTYKLNAFDSLTGETSWEEDFESTDQILGLFDNSVLAMTSSTDNTIKALHADSGKITWQKNSTDSSESLASLNNGISTLNRNSEVFAVTFGDITKVFEAASGKEICSFSGYDNIEIYKEFAVCYDAEKTLTDIIYFEPQKVLYSFDGTIQSLFYEEGKIFFVSQSKSGCIDITTGKVIWENPISGIKFEAVTSDILWAWNSNSINHGSYIWGYDLNSGKLLFQAGDYNSGYLYHLVSIGNRIYKSGDTLYINRLNGNIDALDLSKHQ